MYFDKIDAIGGDRFDDGAGGDNEVYRTIDAFSANFVPPDLPTPITEIYNTAFLNKPFEMVLAEIDRLLQTDLFTVTSNC